MARATARPEEGRIRLSATPWITTVGHGDLPIIASRLRPSRHRVIRRAESSTHVRKKIVVSTTTGPGIPVDPSVTRNFSEA
jgi:hypothetical protein